MHFFYASFFSFFLLSNYIFCTDTNKQRITLNKKQQIELKKGIQQSLSSSVHINLSASRESSVNHVVASKPCKNVEDYTREDAFIRYNQINFLSYLKSCGHKAPTIWPHYEFTIVPDKALFGKEFLEFKNMDDNKFQKEWPLFKDENKEISHYFYGDKIQHNDQRLKSIRLKEFNNDYICSSKNITQEKAEHFLKKHKKIIDEQALTEKDPVAIMLASGGKYKNNIQKAYVIYHIAHKNYAHLSVCRKECHKSIQECIDKSISISDNKELNNFPLLSNNGKKKQKTNNSNESVKKTTILRKKSKKKPKTVSEWQKVINLLKDDNMSDAVHCLLKNVDAKAINEVTEEHKKLLFNKVQTIINNKENNEKKISDNERDLLYIYAKAVAGCNENNNSSDRLCVGDRLFKKGYWKGLDLKFSQNNFSPSLFFNQKDVFFNQFYQTKDKDDVIERKVIEKINKCLENDSYVLCFLLAALPIKNFTYAKLFLNKYFNSHNVKEAISNHNIVSWPISMNPETMELLQQINFQGEKELILKKFIDIIDCNIKDANPKYCKEYQQISIEEKKIIVKDLINKFLDHGKILKNNNSLAWFDVFKFSLFRIIQRWSSFDGVIQSELLDLFNIREHSLRKALISIQKDINNGEDRDEKRYAQLIEHNRSVNDNKTYLEKLLTLELMEQYYNLTKTIDIENAKKLKNNLTLKFLVSFYGGLKKYFTSSILDRQIVASLSLLKVREIITSCQKSRWSTLLKELQKKGSINSKKDFIDPIIFAILGTDISDRVLLQENDEGISILEEKESNEDIKNHFLIVKKILKNAISQYKELDIQSIEKHMTERALLSLIYLVENNKNLNKILEPIVNDIINDFNQVMPGSISKDRKEVKVLATYPFGGNFEVINGGIKEYLEVQKKNK